jgi:hypothetical protein
MKARLLIATFFLVLCPSNYCLANPVIVFQLPSFGGGIALNAGYAFIIDCAADFIVLLLGYLVIKKIKVTASWKFLLYYGLVLIGGIVIDFVSLIPIGILSFFLLSRSDYDKLGFFICAGFLIYFYNYMLSKRFFRIEANQAHVIGIVMAILTNPIIGWIIGGSIHG